MQRAKLMFSNEKLDDDIDREHPTSFGLVFQAETEAYN